MSNKTILVSKNGQNPTSLTSFNKVESSPYDNFEKQKSTFKRNRSANKGNDYNISFNPFINAASPLFRSCLELKFSQNITDVDDLREEFINKINLYNDSALKNGIDNTEVLVTRYLLCTYVDELVNTTYIGSENNWSNNSLLSIFHNETYGGENFFHLLDKFLKAPAKYIHILELMYTCLALGFEGKYRVMDRGQIELNNIKDSLFRQIKIVKGREPMTFYTKQEPAKNKYRLFSKVSYPLLFLSIFLLLVVVYSSLTYALHQQDNEFLNTIKKDYKVFEISDLKGNNE